MWLQSQFLDAKFLLVEEAQRDLFAFDCWDGGDADVDAVAFEFQSDTSVLGESAFGDVEA